MWYTTFYISHWGFSSYRYSPQCYFQKQCLCVALNTSSSTEENWVIDRASNLHQSKSVFLKPTISIFPKESVFSIISGVKTWGFLLFIVAIIYILKNAVQKLGQLTHSNNRRECNVIIPSLSIRSTLYQKLRSTQSQFVIYKQFVTYKNRSNIVCINVGKTAMGVAILDFDRWSRVHALNVGSYRVHTLNARQQSYNLSHVTCVHRSTCTALKAQAKVSACVCSQDRTE